MNSDKEHKKRSYRSWIIAAVVIVILVVSGRLILKSDWLFNKIREMAVQQVNEQLRGQLAIESMHGDVLNGFTVRGVSLQDTTTAEVVHIDSVNVRYNFLPVLFSPHTVESVEIFGTDLLVEQYQDSSWNILQLLPESDQPEEETEPLRWYVENLGLAEVNIDIRSEQYLPDEVLYIDHLFANVSAGMLETGFSGNLRELEFSIREGRLPEAVDVYLAGEARQDQYTLDSIVINTGRSVLRGSARYEEGGEVEQNLSLSPLSWRDISEYATEMPVEQNLQIELSADGTLDDLRLTLDATADGLDQFQISATSDLREPMALSRLNISATGLNAPLLTGLENAPLIGSLDFSGDGTVLFSSPGEADWDATLDIERFVYQDYEFDGLASNYSLQNGSVEMDGNISYQNEEIVMTARADSLFGEQPEWEFHAESNGMNPAIWLNNEQYAGNLNISIDANGLGLSTENFYSSADILVSESQLNGQSFSRLFFSGTINQNRVEGQLEGQLDESRATAEFTLNDWQTIPAYQFDVEMNRLNLAELNGMEEFPTYLNGSIEGRGTSFDPEQLALMATVNFDSSIVNGEEIQALNTDVRIENEFVIVDEGTIESPIADASFSLHHHLFDYTDNSNRLNFNASLKDLQPLGPLFNVERLQSEGSVSGNLGRNSDGMLEFNSELDLENVAVDTLFSSSEISGTLVSYVMDEPEFDLNVQLYEPAVYQKTVQDMQLYGHAKIRENETVGNINMQVSNGNDSSLRHSGEFTIDSLQTTLLTQTLDFETELRELTLERPFTLTYSNSTFSVDTLTISTDQGDAHLQLWVPRIDSLAQQGGLDAQNLNIGMLQQTLLRESYFDGYLTGSVEINNTPDSLSATVTGYLTQLELSEGEMDSLYVNMDVRDEWLTTSLESWHENEMLAEGSFRVPFLPGDPLTFDDQFFEREIQGRFRVFETQLNYWFSFLPEGVPEETNGTIAIQADLGGIAGNPDLEGTLSVSEGLFSGIRVDTVDVEMAYFHENEQVDFTGSIVQNQRRILDFEANIPFLVDLRRAEVHLPDNNDELFVDVTTNNFDLALLNSYVNRDMIRGISGRLEGAVTLSGIMDNLQAEGQMQLAEGSLRVVPAGITLSDISSNMLFRQESIQLERFTASSGPGRLRASGNVALQGLDPGEMNINVTASQFRLLNTSDYRAIINMNATVNGTATEPSLQGSLTFLNGFYFLQDFGEQSVEDVDLDEEGGEESTFSLYDALDMEMTIAFDRQFFIRNQQYLEMEIEIGGEVDLVKEPDEEMQVFGSLEGLDGYASPLGKRFDLEDAMVSFYGPVDNPELQVRSSYTPPQAAGVQIFYIIEGTLQEPEFRFDSQPQLELQDIISYTLFGRPFYELESWEQVVAGSGSSPSAADYALEVLLDRVEMIASQRLGIDVVQIDNSRSGSSNTVIKTGWYLNQSTFFAILSEIGGANPKTLFVLEILLRENLELIITQGDDTRQGIDLQWKRDY